MADKFYVASCVFTEEYPALSKKICDYMREKSVPIIRCCVDKYKVAEFEERMPENYRDEWRAIKHFEKYPAGSVMISLCHNCAAIFEERHPEIMRESLWEYILADKSFKYTDLGGEAITIQDCWRQKENFAEQEAVREILRLMNVKIVELPENHERTKFCGYSLYQPQPPRNPKLAPKRFLYGAQGLFREHTPEQKNCLWKSIAHKFGRKKLLRIAIIAFAD